MFELVGGWTGEEVTHRLFWDDVGSVEGGFGFEVCWGG